MRLAAREMRSPAGIAEEHSEPLAMVLLFIAAGAAVLIDNPIWQDADGMIGTLFSLQRMTLFFWGEDRFASLIPALATPVASPEANLAVQLVLRIGLGILAPLFPCFFLTGGSTAAWRATLMSSALLVAFAPHLMQHELYVQASPYGASFALAGLALLALRHAGTAGAGLDTMLRLLAILLTLAAFLENISLILIAGPLLAIEALAFGSGVALQFGGASLLAVGVGSAAMRLFGAPSATNTGFAESTAGLLGLAHHLAGKDGRFPIAMLTGGLAIQFLLRRRARRTAILPAQEPSLSHWTAMAAVTAVAAVAVFLSSWVVLNHSHPRYLLPTYILASGLGGAALSALCRNLAPAGRGFPALGATTFLLAVAVLRCWPPAAPVLAEPARRPAAEAVAAVVIARGLDGIEGGYWEVWPAVFRAERMMYALGQPPGRVFGLTYRGEARREAFVARLLERGELRIACIDPDPGHCNALVLATMAPPPTRMRVAAPSMKLTGGGTLSFLTLQILNR